jgi:hypothetical protein
MPAIVSTIWPISFERSPSLATTCADVFTVFSIWAIWLTARSTRCRGLCLIGRLGRLSGHLVGVGPPTC